MLQTLGKDVSATSSPPPARHALQIAIYIGWRSASVRWSSPCRQQSPRAMARGFRHSAHQRHGQRQHAKDRYGKAGRQSGARARGPSAASIAADMPSARASPLSKIPPAGDTQVVSAARPNQHDRADHRRTGSACCPMQQQPQHHGRWCPAAATSLTSQRLAGSRGLPPPRSCAVRIHANRCQRLHRTPLNGSSMASPASPAVGQSDSRARQRVSLSAVGRWHRFTWRASLARDIGGEGDSRLRLSSTRSDLARW